MSIAKHGRMVSTGKTLSRSPELSSKPASSHLVANHEELRETDYEFSFRSEFVHTLR
jgi:hypothetical protein